MQERARGRAGLEGGGGGEDGEEEDGGEVGEGVERHEGLGEDELGAEPEEEPAGWGRERGAWS